MPRYDRIVALRDYIRNLKSSIESHEDYFISISQNEKLKNISDLYADIQEYLEGAVDSFQNNPDNTDDYDEYCSRDRTHLKFVDAYHKLQEELRNFPNTEKTGLAGIMADDKIIDFLDNYEHTVNNSFDSPIVNTVDDSAEAEKRRDLYVKNIETVSKAPDDLSDYSDISGLNEKNKKEYDKYISYWVKNVKNKGLNASLEYVNSYLSVATSGDSPAVGKAMNDILYTVTCVKKPDGTVDESKTKDMLQGFQVYTLGKSKEAGKKLSQLKADSKGEQDWQINDKFSLTKERLQNQACSTMSLALSSMLETTAYNSNIPELSSYPKACNHTLQKKYIKTDTEFKEGNKLLSEITSKTTKLEGPARDAHFKNILDFINAEKKNVDQQFNHLDQRMIDQCSSLNKLLESFENTENAYTLHSNSKLYEDMIKSMRDLRAFSQDYISEGKGLPDNKLGEAVDKLKTVENRVKDYLDNRTKVSYSHKAGEIRRDLALCAYSQLNQSEFQRRIDALNKDLLNAGKKPLSEGALEKRFSANGRDLTANDTIAKLADQYKLDNNLKRMLMHPDSLDSFKVMFDTKKTARLVNWNSTQYNNANRAISSFQKNRDTVVKLMTGDEIPDPEKMKDAIKNLQSSYGECRTSLQEYCAKVLADPNSLDKKSTSAGIARAAGATGALGEFLGKPVSFDNKVKVKKYAEIFREEMSNQKTAGNHNKHRRAASNSMEKLHKENAGKKKSVMM